MTTHSLQHFKSELFKALAHPTRIRVLELLRTGEMTVSELQLRLALEAASVSQQLGVLRAQELVTSRREGSSVFYRIVDPKVFELLDLARSIFDTRVAILQALTQQDREGPGTAERLPGAVLQPSGGR
ncbi:MAG: metalloregulator ArsR/SmtB family transcription factor [Chloroflexota bacterium]